MKRALLLLAAVATGCASAPPLLINLSQERWEAEVAARRVRLDQVTNPLMTTVGMREEAMRMAGNGTPTERLAKLQRGLFDSASFPFTYLNRGTFTAAEAFHRRQGNCLSFTNLFVAMARSLGVPVTTALVMRSQGSEQEGDLIVVNTHVVAVLSYAGGTATYDFDLSRPRQPTALKVLDDMWITALYLNNRGADELRASHPEAARELFENAVRLAPEFAPAWGNVGVARRRAGDINGALDAYAQALLLDPGNPTILTNLAALHRSLGREREAQRALAAARLSEASPHVLLVRGDIEMAKGKVREAISLYRTARRRGPELVEPWIALARAEIARERPATAAHHLRKALEIEPDNAIALALSRAIAGSQTSTSRSTP